MSSWTHIVVEGYCFFNEAKEGETNEVNIPKYCINGPGSFGIYCI
jgi:hypothetical protein